MYRPADRQTGLDQYHADATLTTVTHRQTDTCTDRQTDKPVVDVARNVQCCVHTRDSSCRGQTHRWTDGWTDRRTDRQTDRPVIDRLV